MDIFESALDSDFEEALDEACEPGALSVWLVRADAVDFL